MLRLCMHLSLPFLLWREACTMKGHVTYDVTCVKATDALADWMAVQKVKGSVAAKSEQSGLAAYLGGR